MRKETIVGIATVLILLAIAPSATAEAQYGETYWNDALSAYVRWIGSSGADFVDPITQHGAYGEIGDGYLYVTVTSTSSYHCDFPDRVELELISCINDGATVWYDPSQRCVVVSAVTAPAIDPSVSKTWYFGNVCPS